nr:ATP-binding cassette domain-containing protein [Nocardioides luti]
MVQIRDLSVLYRGRGRRADKLALDGVSVSLGAGETLGLVGESGSGKSTLGNCVLGLVQPTHGTITFDGRDITHRTARERRALSTQVQAVFQDPYSSFNPHRTIEQTVGETLDSLPRMSRAERRARIVAMLERVGLDQSALTKFPAQFSGGQRQRIAIARALLPDPRLVVCDELVSALDLSVQAQVLNLLLELQRERGVAYLFITHDLAVVRHMSTRVAVLQHGQLVEEGTSAEVTEHPTQPYTRRLVAASLDADADLQRVRRATRKAVADSTRTSMGGGAGSDVALLGAFEQQAVAEATAQPTPRASIVSGALIQAKGGASTIETLVALRAAILEMASRTSATMTPPDLLTRLEGARADLCRAVIADGRTSEFLDLLRQLAAAIEDGDRVQARMIVNFLDSVEGDVSSVAHDRPETGSYKSRS